MAAARWPDLPFMAVLPETAAAYGIAVGEISYGSAATEIARLTSAYREAGITAAHRVGLLLENRPAALLHWLALNSLGASIVPINPDLRSVELEYLVGHSEMALAVAIPSRHADLRRAGLALVVGPDETPPMVGLRAGRLPHDECALLYTSGTTGMPKGCVLPNAYFLEAGRWYAEVGGLCALREGVERMLTPLPLFHMNALAYSAMAMIQTGGCLIVLDRFHPRSWWASVAAARATIVHYLGVMPAILMQSPPSPAERDHAVRFGFGANVYRRLHAEAEARFGFPLIEAWAMTETGAGAVIAATHEPRHVGENCFGRVAQEIEVRIEADDGTEASQGELLVRRAGADARRGFFAEYLKEPEATEIAWQGGWFHTGDIVSRDTDGSFRFMDRKKNVIRRSGENISALEVEGVLQQHPEIRTAAVAAVPDAVRGDEVFACIVPEHSPDDPARIAAEIAEWCRTRLAYYKAPGWLAFVDAVPITSTNKIQRGNLKALAAELCETGRAIDLRHLKRRGE